MKSRLSRSSIPFSIWGLGFATMLINASTVIVFGLSPLYMKTVLGASTGLIGFIEGLVEAISFIMKLFSGIVSDYLKKRKLIMMIGFICSTMARPLIALFPTFWGILFSRVLGRIGNGLQATPRDALIGDLSPPHLKGACYGLRQSLSMFGSFLGGIIAFVAMLWSDCDFQLVFWMAAFLGGLAVLILFVLVKEPKEHPVLDPQPLQSSTSKKRPIRIEDLKKLGRSYWTLMLLVSIFMLSRFSEAMLTLHAYNNFNLGHAYAPLIVILYNGSSALASYPIGAISDTMSRQTILAIGFCVLVAADIVLALAPSLPVLLIGVLLWGVQIAITQNMFTALIVDSVPKDLKGTAFGFFYLISALSLLIASTMGGFIASFFGEFVMFLSSAFIGAMSLLTLLIVSTRKEECVTA